MKKLLELGSSNKIYKEIIRLASIVILLCLVGCTSIIEEERDSKYTHESLETMEEPLVVFYEPSAYHLLKSFKESHPDIKIQQEAIKCYEDNHDLETFIKKKGVPDLILGNSSSAGLYLMDWYADGHIANMSDFCSKDESIDTEDYFPETFEVFKEKDSLYALPLGISMDCFITTESKYLNSAFVKLEEGYTGRELLDVLMEEIEKAREEGEIFSEEVLDPLEAMYWLDGISQISDGIEIDEELFRQCYEFMYLCAKESDEAKDYWFEQGKDYSSVNGYAWPNAFEPRRYEGKFNVSLWNIGDAPAMALSYAETANQHYIEEGIKAFYLPTADDGNKYKARVEVWGAICEESPQKELAYELLRALMDEEINSFGTLCGVSPTGLESVPKNVYPIKKENALSLLDRFETQTQELIFGQSSSQEYITLLERKDISDTEKEKHQKMLNGISGLYHANIEINKVSGIFLDYYDANISDYKYCYLETIQALNGHSKNDDSESDLVLSENSLVSNDDSEQIAEESQAIDSEDDVSDEVKELKEKIRNTEVGESFFFGMTEQDNNIENGAEPIEWIMLEKNEDKAFVISKRILEWLTFSKYNDVEVEYGDTAYSVSTSGSNSAFTWDIKRNQQRAWLANDLYKNGFTKIEQEIMLLTHYKDDIVTGDEYDDYLYIPSREDVEKYMQDVNLRKAEMTAYVAEKANQVEGEFGCWSLRSVLMVEKKWSEVKYTRQITEDGEFGATYTSVPNGVRPVMWLDIS